MGHHHLEMLFVPGVLEDPLEDPEVDFDPILGSRIPIVENRRALDSRRGLRLSR